MEYDEAAFSAILEVIEGREGEIVSTALIKKEAEVDTTRLREPIKQLIVLGELTLIHVQQSGRVTLNESVHVAENGQMTLQGKNTVWRCYIAENHKERYHSGLFTSKEAAKQFLRQRAGDSVDELEQVPPLKNVYAAEIPGFESYGSHTVVVRGERVNDQLPLQE